MNGAASYPDDVSYLLDELACLDRLIERRLATWWADDTAEGGLSHLYISDAEVVDLLGSSSPSGDGGFDPTPAGRDASPSDGALEAAVRRTRSRKRSTRAEGRTLRFDTLAERFGLDASHRDALLVAVAPELDPLYGRIYAYLQDDMTQTAPTVGLALRLLGGDAETRLRLRELFAPQSALRRHRLLSVERPAGTALPSATLGVDERVVDYLLGGDALPSELDESAAATTPTTTLADVPVDGRCRRRLERAAYVIAGEDVDAVEDSEGGDGVGATAGDDAADDTRPNPGPGARPALVHLNGPYGVGKSAAAEALCATASLPLVSITLGLGEDGWTEMLGLADREARLRGAALAVAVDPVETSEDATAVGALFGTLVRRIDGFNGLAFLLSTDPVSSPAFADVNRHAVLTESLPRPGYARRRALWEAVPDLPDGADADRLAATFRFTPGEMTDALATARRRARGGEITDEALSHACRAHARKKLGHLARRVEPRHVWNDIVLTADRFAQLRDIAARIRFRGRVYAEWGFEEKYTLGNGLTILFTGPSGTGKTMAAEILAADAGLDLYKVDLAGVVSKYIGETERNLREIFDEAEGSDAILLFDEADALFGERSEVSDARDRYANIEVNYLLQRIEEHDGITLLTTNLSENIDEAFERRIHATVEFPMPDEASRAEIWRRVFPGRTPVGDLDVPFLSTLELSGGEIKNVALNAAFYAAEDGTAVEMCHVVYAVRREYQKIGRLFSGDDFGEYKALLNRTPVKVHRTD